MTNKEPLNQTLYNKNNLQRQFEKQSNIQQKEKKPLTFKTYMFRRWFLYILFYVGI